MSGPEIAKTVRGARPRFHDDETHDRLIAMVLTLTSELAVLRHRLDDFQRLAERNGWLETDQLDEFRPGLEERGRREAWRVGLLDRVFYLVEQELSELRRGENSERYWQAVGESEEEEEGKR